MKIFVTWSLPYYWARYLLSTSFCNGHPIGLYITLVFISASGQTVPKNHLLKYFNLFSSSTKSIRRMWLLLLHSLFIIVCQITYVNKLLPLDSSQNFQSFLTIWTTRLASLVTQSYLYPLICNNHPPGAWTGDVQVKSTIHFSLS